MGGPGRGASLVDVMVADLFFVVDGPLLGCLLLSSYARTVFYVGLRSASMQCSRKLEVGLDFELEK